MEFEVVGEAPDKAPPPQTNQEEVNSITNGNKDSAQPSTSSKGQQLHTASRCVDLNTEGQTQVLWSGRGSEIHQLEQQHHRQGDQEVQLSEGGGRWS